MPADREGAIGKGDVGLVGPQECAAKRLPRSMTWSAAARDALLGRRISAAADRDLIGACLRDMDGRLFWPRVRPAPNSRRFGPIMVKK